MRNLTVSNGLSADIERMAYRQRLEIFLGCRDAACTLTADSLTKGIKLKAIVDASTAVSTFADEALEIVTEEYRPRVHCKEGCWYCCSKPGVLTSIPDLLRIVTHVQSTLSDEDVSALKAHTRQYAVQIEGRNFNDPVNESILCPLLVDGCCSVYDVRPLVCRGYNSTNVDACRQAQTDTTVGVPIFAVLKDVTDGASVGAAQSLEAAGFNGTMVDLGSALHIALGAGEGFPEAIVEGGTSLAPAENSSWLKELWNEVRQTARRVGVSV